MCLRSTRIRFTEIVFYELNRKFPKNVVMNHWCGNCSSFIGMNQRHRPPPGARGGGGGGGSADV